MNETNYLKLSLFVFIFVALGMAPKLIFAAGIKYFEFAPDSGENLNVASVATPYQVVYPQNDFLSGFDIWIDNSGDAGSASFGLRDADNNLLTYATVTIPHIDPQWGGQVFHVDFDNAVAVSSTEMYKIKIVSSMPNLRLYYADRTEILTQNTQTIPVGSIFGAAELEGTEQNFIFKMALYENDDALAPIISNVASITNPQNLTIQFNGNEPLDYKITLTPASGGATQIKDWSSVYSFCNLGIFTCGATFATTAGVTYNYELSARDYAQNTSQVGGTITTPTNPTGPTPQPSQPAPVISNVQITPTDSGVTVYWQTDQAANSNLTVSRDPFGSNVVVSVTDETVEFFHNLSLNNYLSPQTTYFATLKSVTPSGQSASQILNFTTAAESQTTNPSSTPNPTTGPTNPIPTNPTTNNNPLNPTNQTNPLGPGGSPEINESNLPEARISQITDSSGNAVIVVEWNAPPSGEPNRGYQIDVLDASNNLAERLTAAPGVHRVEIKGLPPGNYHLLIYANNDGILTRIARVLLVNLPKGQVTLIGSFLTFLGSTLFYTIAIVLIVTGVIAAFYIIKLRRV